MSRSPFFSLVALALLVGCSAHAPEAMEDLILAQEEGAAPSSTSEGEAPAVIPELADARDLPALGGSLRQEPAEPGGIAELDAETSADDVLTVTLGGLGTRGAGVGGGGAAVGGGLAAVQTQGMGSGRMMVDSDASYGQQIRREESARPSPEPSKRDRASRAVAAGPVPASAATGYAVAVSAPPPPMDGYAQLQAIPSANSEQYTDYGVNGFTDVHRDALSTFAVDVDTASYTVTRRKLTEGYLPPAAAVRVEEFVNYLPYEYVQPRRGEPFAVDFEAAPSPWNPRNHIVRVGVQGKQVAYDQRKPVHLTFLIDTSGSMQSADKLELVKRSLIMLTEELQDGDTVAIATYAGNTSIALPPTPISHRAEIERALQRLTAGGSTAMSSGIDLAYQLADRTYSAGAVNRVIVASDGDANVGSTSHSEISQKIHGYAERGITLTTLGFGNGNYKDTMMERLANDGDGNYFYIDGEQEARRVLVDKLTGTLEVIAKDVKIQVDFNPDAVMAYRLIGYENRDVADRDFRNDKVDAGEIGAGHQVTALYEVALLDGYRGQDLATVRIRNKAPGPDAPAVERAYPLSSNKVRASLLESSDQLRVALAAGTFAEILRGSPHVSEVSLSQVAQLARQAQRAEYPEDKELVTLIERAAQLRGENPTARR
ncbi:MAG: VWA domain-containing protein [Deltaproteobacteria bacterium]|nr:VWA domain-containing protein [Deltaproteobacteria bacterium]